MSGNQLKRKRETATRKWTLAEEKLICEKLRETVLSGGKIEHPTAKVYYENILEGLQFQDVNCIKLKAKVLNLKTGYLKMIDWRSMTGQGLLETDGCESVNAYILSKCPLFEILDEIFGSKVNINPPIIIESGMDNWLDDYEERDELGSPSSASEPAANLQVRPSEICESQEAGNEGTVTFTPVTSKAQKRKSNDGLSALTEVQKKRVDLMQQKLNADNEWRGQQLELEKMKLDMESAKMEQDLVVKKLELEKSERIEKYRIDQEIKYKLEIAKLQMDKQ